MKEAQIEMKKRLETIQAEVKVKAEVTEIKATQTELKAEVNEMKKAQTKIETDVSEMK